MVMINGPVTLGFSNIYFPFRESFPTTLLTVVPTHLAAKLLFVTLTSFIISMAFRVIWNYPVCLIACFLTRSQL